MTDPKRRLVERLADPVFLEGLERRSMEELRAMREQAREGENELSFERRLCQARIDILAAELQRREGRGDPDLVARLPEILATDARREDTPLPARAPDHSIPRNAAVNRRRVEEIVGEQTLTRLSALQVEEVRSILDSLAEYERDVSARRRHLQEVMDTIQGEIVRRYTSGEADPPAALT